MRSHPKADSGWVFAVFLPFAPWFAAVWPSATIQVRKNSLNIKFLGGILLGHPGPRRRDIPDKNFMQVAFFCCFRQGVAGMSRDLGRDVPDLEKLYARKLWADLSYPNHCPKHSCFSVRMSSSLLKFRKTREGWNCRFQKTPRTEGGDKVPAVWAQGSRQVCLSRCPKSQTL